LLSGKATFPFEIAEYAENVLVLPEGNFNKHVFKRESRLEINALTPVLRTYCIPRPGTNSTNEMGADLKTFLSIEKN